LKQVDVGKQQCFRTSNVHFAEEHELIFDVVIWWKKQYKELIYLVNIFELAYEATWRYGKRFKFETMFSDIKSQNFNLQKSHSWKPTEERHQPCTQSRV